MAKLSKELGDDNNGFDGGGGEKNKRLIPIVADFSNLDSVASAGNEIVKKFKKIDFLVNNAGIAQASAGAATPQGYDLIFGGMFFYIYLLMCVMRVCVHVSITSYLFKRFHELNDPCILTLSHYMLEKKRQYNDDSIDT